ncbi:Iron(II)-dependent oxidoreductase EgtB [Aquisphaera giovannonii]|uniref:Iron(II)-dependent oxidoreductase EgtB n=1 Tax=Aquisphaera giovannonii TaxID=406548 RepID=A0A5B9W301_9BACT|nr:ergothioneine biosynthesis protein EgtB [Aquisphaera giovannonii]QEH34614.1 Iron(II)-dependent oxidoreductase EgtB [Aquisphaera giovannonii]
MTTHLAEEPACAIHDPGAGVSDFGLDREGLRACYDRVRQTTEALCSPLEVEDYVIQSMPDASPAKWHLAHTSWFFETFVLSSWEGGLAPVDSRYGYLFNSYYNAVGERIARDRRGLLSRPTVAEVYRYRSAVDDRVREFLDRSADDELDRVRAAFILGLNHEQQHQELIVTDVKHGLAANPLKPSYRGEGGERAAAQPSDLASGPPRWVEFPGGVRPIGHDGGRFAFDNEGPRHEQLVPPFALADRPVTNREFLAFLEDGGYDRPQFWLSDGWYARSRNGWTGPLYWEREEGAWRSFTLDGLRPLGPDEPVCHVSFYEADAYARWAGARLATEAEWETAAVLSGAVVDGNFLESARFHPAAVPATTSPGSSKAPSQLFGDVWEWTQSPYTPYRGFKPAAGALGEYNGKFMCNQIILRGGSCASPRSHIRPTYRNFFPPESRWQFTGIRLAKDV